ncbi:uncharacterized protein LOC127987735 [Carassius gibelio]|uniref:uncharacterized protein LOC127987735 n=1 Tax=Carassius gibelio TaxID=101364 RepID=UPI002279A3CE|nr:uncharacterized protein LOC127987735 [Carassius gibelio]
MNLGKSDHLKLFTQRPITIMRSILASTPKDITVLLNLLNVPLIRLNLYTKFCLSLPKYLGLWFDGKLTWKCHISKIESKCKKILNCMPTDASHNWGASRSALLCMYQALIRSCFDYGCIVYGSASKSLLKKLDIIQSKALRICCGAVKTSPVDAIGVEMGEMPLDIRREKLAITYWVNLQQSANNHLTPKVLEECWEYSYDGGHSFGWKSRVWAKECCMDNKIFCPSIPLTDTPPWKVPEPLVDLSLLDKPKEEYTGNEVNAFLNNTFYSVLQIFTDGSKEPISQKVGLGVYIPQFKKQISLRLTDEMSVYTAELPYFPDYKSH